MAAYRQRGDRIVLEDYEYGQREQIYIAEKHVATLERWHEKQGHGSAGVTMKGGSSVGTKRHVLQGMVFEAYLERMKYFADEAQEWYAYIHDSSTFCEFAVRQYLSGVMKVKDNKMIWAQATDELERFYMALFPDLDITTFVLSHASTERAPNESGVSKYQVRLPGRLGRDIIASFGEVYRAFVVPSKEDGPLFYMQTEADAMWRCSSQLKVPSPLGPTPHWKEIYKLAVKMLPEGEQE
jgi:hypothetical protein